MSVPGDRIAVRGIRAYGRHGALEGERDREQPFDLDLELEIDLAAARASDDLADTLDYAAVHARVVAIVQERSYALLERLGDEILRALLADARVRAASVTIGKPALLAGATPSVTLRASRASTGSAAGSAGATWP
ncbi:MAG: dihydroneopterin aldolase [Candidatus Baltobacteraceae bacterium]